MYDYYDYDDDEQEVSDIYLDTYITVIGIIFLQAIFNL